MVRSLLTYMVLDPTFTSRSDSVLMGYLDGHLGWYSAFAILLRPGLPRADRRRRRPLDQVIQPGVLLLPEQRHDARLCHSTLGFAATTEVD